MKTYSHTPNAKYPDPNVDPQKKDSAYRLKYLKAMYSNFELSGLKMFFNDKVNAAKLIQYATGTQDTGQYKKRFDCWDDGQDTFVNIDWQVVHLVSKYLNIMIDKLMKYEFDVVATPICAAGKNEMDYQKVRIKEFMRLKKEGYFDDAGGVPPKEMLGFDPETLPSDPEELDVWLEMNDKHEVAMWAEMEVKNVLNKNKWYQIKKEVVKNMVYLGVGSCSVSNDNYGNTLLNCVDPETMLVGSSRYEDFRGISHQGYQEVITFSQFKAETCHSGVFSEEDYKYIYETIATTQAGLGEQLSNTVNTYDKQTNEKLLKVFRGWFKDFNQYTYHKKSKADGVRLYPEKTGYGSSPNYYKKPDREIINDGYSVVYKGTWIIKTDFIYNDGIQDQMEVNRANPRNIELPIKIIAPNMTRGRIVSLLHEWMPIVDQINLSWYKYQEAMGKSIPDGYAFDLDTLVSIPMGKGGTALKPNETIDLFMKTGIIVYKGSAMKSGQNTIPVTPMTNANFQKAQSYLENIMQMVSLLQSLSGLNPAADASLPETGTLNGVASAALAGTQAALGYMTDGLKSLISDMAHAIVRLRQNTALMGIGGSTDALGVYNAKFWSLHSKKTTYDLGIQIMPRPTSEEWSEFYGLIQRSLDTQAIDVSDFIFLKDIDNLKMAYSFFAMREKKKKMEMQQQEQSLVQQNAAAQQQSAIIAEDEKRKTLELQYELELRNQTMITRMQAEMEHGRNVTTLAQVGNSDHIKELNNTRDNITKIAQAHLDNKNKLEQIKLQNEGKIAAAKAKPKPKAKA
jgi:hypothetical protein